MSEKHELVILFRDDNGRYSKQIKLGEEFVSEMNEMASSVSWLGLQVQKSQYESKLLNWKINSLITNRITFSCKGVDLSKSIDDMTIGEISNCVHIVEGISDGLYALIDDFKAMRESGDPKVIRDHIMFLLAVYQEVKHSDFFGSIISTLQQDMVESQFFDCIKLFDSAIQRAIDQNSWSARYNLISAFFGGCYGYQFVHIDSAYQNECHVVYLEEATKIHETEKPEEI